MSRIDAQQIDDEAVRWFVLLREETATDADRRGLAEWLAASPAHRDAWSELARLWGGLDALAPGIQSDVVPIRPRAAKALPARPVRRWGRFAAAAIVLIGVGIGTTMLLPAGLFADHATAVGERRVVQLADGSSVELGSASAIDVDFGPGRRRVTLLAGEAFFTVVKDPDRAFVVAAKQGEVKVLGTAFNVKIEDGVDVAVAEHTVEVSMQGRTPAHLAEGRGIHYDASGLSGVVAADLETIQAWRQDRLIFHDAPLRNVIAELQRYRYGRIQLLGSSLGDRRVTAVFDTRRPDAALDSIARSLDLRIFRVTNLFVGISPN